MGSDEKILRGCSTAGMLVRGTQKSTAARINRKVRYERLTPGGVLQGGVGSVLNMGEVSGENVGQWLRGAGVVSGCRRGLVPQGLGSPGLPPSLLVLLQGVSSLIQFVCSCRNPKLTVRAYFLI